MDPAAAAGRQPPNPSTTTLAAPLQPPKWQGTPEMVAASHQPVSGSVPVPASRCIPSSANSVPQPPLGCSRHASPECPSHTAPRPFRPTECVGIMSNIRGRRAPTPQGEEEGVQVCGRGTRGCRAGCFIEEFFFRPRSLEFFEDFESSQTRSEESKESRFKRKESKRSQGEFVTKTSSGSLAESPSRRPPSVALRHWVSRSARA